MDSIKRLEKDKVKVVPVTIGDEVDPNELIKRANNKQYLVKEKDDVKPSQLATKIMDKVLRGKGVGVMKRCL